MEDFLTKAVEDTICQGSFARPMRAAELRLPVQEKNACFERALSFEHLSAQGYVEDFLLCLSSTAFCR